MNCPPFFTAGDPAGFTKSLGNICTEFSDDVLKIGTGVGVFGLGIWLVLDAGAAEPMRATQSAQEVETPGGNPGSNLASP